MVSVRTSIFGRPRRLPSHRRADLYTLICEEPTKPPGPGGTCSPGMPGIAESVTRCSTRAYSALRVSRRSGPV